MGKGRVEGVENRLQGVSLLLLYIHKYRNE